jgi:hypothetical protein
VTGGLVAIVCGGRDFYAPALVYRALDGFHSRTPIGALVHGAARGADALAAAWAAERGIREVAFPADWAADGKRAGSIRNARMLAFIMDHAERAVVAFPGGSGTAHMVRIAQSAGVPTWEMSFAWEKTNGGGTP